MKPVNTDNIRLQEVPFSFEGRNYKLRCTMNVVADVQDQNGGDLLSSLTTKNFFRGILVWVSSMMNNYAEAEGWEDYTPYTARYLGNKISLKDLPIDQISEMLNSALFEQNVTVTDQKGEGNEKN